MTTDTTPKKFTRELPVQLTDEEKQKYGKMLADKLQEEKLAEDRAKQIAAGEKAKIKAISTEIARIAAARRDGAELRPVECYESWVNGAIHVIRTDTSEIVEIRPAMFEDRQASFPEYSDAPDSGDPVEPAGEAGPPGEDPPGRMITNPDTGDQVWTSEPAPEGEDADRVDAGESEPADGESEPSDGDDTFTEIVNDQSEPADEESNVIPFGESTTASASRKSTNESSARSVKAKKAAAKAKPPASQATTIKPNSTASEKSDSGSKSGSAKGEAAPAKDGAASTKATSPKIGKGRKPRTWAEKHYGGDGKPRSPRKSK